MRSPRNCFLGLLLLAVVGHFGLRLQSSRADDAQPGAPKKASNKARKVGPFRAGVALSMHSQDPNYSYLKAVKEIRELGATDVSILVHFYQDHSASPKPKRHAFRTPSDKNLVNTIKTARKLGLRVLVMPILLLEKPREEDWRGNIDPPNWKTWRDAYLKEMLHFARLSEKAGANVFSVGSELSSLEHRLGDWKMMIRKIRSVFTGLLIYSANWDHYDQLNFWSELDLMGISGYYELTESLSPKKDELLKSWKKVQKTILGWRQGNRVKIPLVFTEIGYASQDGCASKPWNYYLSETVDCAEQRLCYEVFLEVWDQKPGLKGVYFYEWWGEGGLKDHTYTPKGKPAEKVLRRWFQKLRKRAKKGQATSKPSKAPKKAG